MDISGLMRDVQWQGDVLLVQPLPKRSQSWKKWCWMLSAALVTAVLNVQGSVQSDGAQLPRQLLLH